MAAEEQIKPEKINKYLRKQWKCREIHENSREKYMKQVRMELKCT